MYTGKLTAKSNSIEWGGVTVKINNQDGYYHFYDGYYPTGITLPQLGGLSYITYNSYTDLSAVSGMDTGAKAYVADFGIYEYIAGATDPIDGEFVVNSADGRWFLRIPHGDAILEYANDIIQTAEQSYITINPTEIYKLPEKNILNNNDLLLIEDSSNGFTKRKLKINTLIQVADTQSYITINPEEIYKLPEKSIPDDNDLLLIEDSSNGFTKKKLKVSNIISSPLTKYSQGNSAQLSGPSYQAITLVTLNSNGLSGLVKASFYLEASIFLDSSTGTFACSISFDGNSNCCSTYYPGNIVNCRQNFSGFKYLTLGQNETFTLTVIKYVSNPVNGIIYLDNPRIDLMQVRQ
jgi:hypothetical protein